MAERVAVALPHGVVSVALVLVAVAVHLVVWFAPRHLVGESSGHQSGQRAAAGVAEWAYGLHCEANVDHIVRLSAAVARHALVAAVPPNLRRSCCGYPGAVRVA